MILKAQVIKMLSLICAHECYFHSHKTSVFTILLFSLLNFTFSFNSMRSEFCLAIIWLAFRSCSDVECAASLFLFARDSLNANLSSKPACVYNKYVSVKIESNFLLQFMRIVELDRCRHEKIYICNDNVEPVKRFILCIYWKMFNLS